MSELSHHSLRFKIKVILEIEIELEFVFLPRNFVL